MSPAEAARVLPYSDIAFFFFYISHVQDKEVSIKPGSFWRFLSQPLGVDKARADRTGLQQTGLLPGSLDVNQERCSHHTVTRGIFWKILVQEG